MLFPEYTTCTLFILATVKGIIMQDFFQWWVIRPEHIDDRPYIKEACLYAWEAGYEAAMKENNEELNFLLDNFFKTEDKDCWGMMYQSIIVMRERRALREARQGGLP
jgi:hypothetical protein